MRSESKNARAGGVANVRQFHWLIALSLAAAGAVLPVSQAQTAPGATISSDTKTPAATSSPASVAGQGQSAAETLEEPLKEVIVTAEKRPENELDVPTSLQVLSGNQLQAEGALHLADYANQIPGLTFSGAQGPGQGQPVLRGIATGNDSSALVGIYLDGVPVTASSPVPLDVKFFFDPDIVDIQNIEVLEGPQSTLYGASAMGGLIMFQTKPPDLTQVEANVRVDGSSVDGGASGYGLDGAINVPVVSDTVGLRAAVFYRDDPGFTENNYYGEKNINSDTDQGAYVSLRGKISDDLETTVSGLLQDMVSDGPDMLYLNPKTLKPLYGNLGYSSPINQPTNIKYETLADVTNLNLHFATLTNTISDVSLSNSSYSDLSLFAGLLGFPAGDFISYRDHADSKRFSDELRLVSAPGKIEWLLGGFFTDEKDSNPVDAFTTNSAGMFLPPTSPLFNVYTYLADSVYKEEAIYGDLTYHLTDKVDATVGARYSSDRQSYTAVSSGILGVNNLAGNSSASSTNYLATVRYKPTSDVMLYVRGASAYRPGGPNILNAVEIAAGVPTSFGPDTLWDYEAGIKGSGWDHRVTYSADIYHMHWEDVQLNVITQGFVAIENAASAKSNGAEASVKVVPLDGLSVSLKAAYTNAEITSSDPAVGFVNGDPLPYAPKVSAAALVDYLFAPVDGVTPTVGLTYADHGSERTAFTNGVSYRLPSYDTLDLRGGIEWSRYSLIARIDNVDNEYGLTDAGPNDAVGSPLTGPVIEPRTFGLSFSATF